jgi:hypothetical protein
MTLLLCPFVWYREFVCSSKLMKGKLRPCLFSVFTPTRQELIMRFMGTRWSWNPLLRHNLLHAVHWSMTIQLSLSSLQLHGWKSYVFTLCVPHVCIYYMCSIHLSIMCSTRLYITCVPSTNPLRVPPACPLYVFYLSVYYVFLPPVHYMCSTSLSITITKL